MTITPETILDSLMDFYLQRSAQLSAAHLTFLQTQLTGMKVISQFVPSTLSEQIGMDEVRQERPALFTFEDLNEFAAGSIEKCLGAAYAIYEGRQCPRIPNSKLLLMSRIVAIEGQKRKFDNRPHITAEYDVPVDPWYMQTSQDKALPVSVMLEVGLQPCGFLSAWLETALLFPEVDYYFRNLDGNLKILNQFDPRGKVITTHASLLKSFSSGSTIIQEFAIEMFCDGVAFCIGTTSFGFFPKESLMAQNGIDGGKKVAPSLHNGNSKAAHSQVVNVTPAKNTLLDLLDSVTIVPGGGDFGSGYAYGHRRNAPDDWYYRCHFKGDPVMPGSLGIESIFQLFDEYIRSLEPGAYGIQIASGSEFSWKYRGQVLKPHTLMQVEAHFSDPVQDGTGYKVCGDASLWADDIRIYTVNQLCVHYQK